MLARRAKPYGLRSVDRVVQRERSLAGDRGDLRERGQRELGEAPRSRCGTALVARGSALQPLGIVGLQRTAARRAA
jgi:hypothetical protein